MRGWITADFLNKKSQEMLKKTFSASWPFLLQQRLGHVQNTLVRDIQCSGNLLEVIGQVIQSFTGLLIYLVVAINISPVMTLSTLVAGAILLLLIRPFMRRIQQGGADMGVTEKKVSHFLSEHILGMKAVKASGEEGAAFASSQKLFNHLCYLQTRLALIRSLSTSFFQPFSLIFVIILFAVTYKTPGFNLISFAATLYLIQKIFTYLESGQTALNSAYNLLPYARNVHQFSRMLEAHEESLQEVREPLSLFESIEFKKVSLAYQDKTYAVVDVDFSVVRGETVALIGPSGAGKTSVADLLLGLFQPTSGEILVDGKSLVDISIQGWRNSLGYVAQDVFLLNDTIEENIRFYSDVSHEDIVSAAKQANIYDFVMGLPEGFQTTTGDRGVMLSGGQRQRIVLARALARKPAVLILDEATSALDQESERLIQESIRNLHGKVTVLVIAHRLSTVENADRIVVLDGGRITEQGSPAELLKNPSSYFSRHYHRA